MLGIIPTPVALFAGLEILGVDGAALGVNDTVDDAVLHAFEPAGSIA